MLASEPAAARRRVEAAGTYVLVLGEVERVRDRAALAATEARLAELERGGAGAGGPVVTTALVVGAVVLLVAGALAPVVLQGRGGRTPGAVRARSPHARLGHGLETVPDVDPADHRRAVERWTAAGAVLSQVRSAPDYALAEQTADEVLALLADPPPAGHAPGDTRVDARGAGTVVGVAVADNLRQLCRRRSSPRMSSLSLQGAMYRFVPCPRYPILSP